MAGTGAGEVDVLFLVRVVLVVGWVGMMVGNV